MLIIVLLSVRVIVIFHSAKYILAPVANANVCNFYFWMFATFTFVSYCLRLSVCHRSLRVWVMLRVRPKSLIRGIYRNCEFCRFVRFAAIFHVSCTVFLSKSTHFWCKNSKTSHIGPKTTALLFEAAVNYWHFIFFIMPTKSYFWHFLKVL